MNLINTAFFEPRNFIVVGIMCVLALILIRKFTPVTE